MRISIDNHGDDQSDGASEDELRSLHQWLLDNPEIRRQAGIELGGEPGPAGSMGGPLEYVQLVMDSGFGLANLALAVVTWRSTRPRPPAVTFERDGVTVTLTGEDPEAAARLLEALTRTDA
ncbi:hypothetical protein [Streptomyces sp. NPDC086023]|uniref:effector-associated constant component EACC1 n=1 Tax=Streptomyces sp. NPDC086023 TaxID=3365746 RepID=UPI0037CCD856